MVKYKTAVTNKEWKKVSSFKYDGGFNNWIDPRVLKKYTSSKKSAKKSWKDSYGFKIVRFLPWDGKNKQTANYTNCIKKCAKLVGEIVFSHHVLFIRMFQNLLNFVGKEEVCSNAV